MADFVPAYQMLVWKNMRPSTSSVVWGVDTSRGDMWIQPIDGGSKYTVKYADGWSEVVRHPQVVEIWFLAGPPGSGSSRWQGFFTRAAAIAAVVDGTSVALLHVLPDGTTELEYFI